MIGRGDEILGLGGLGPYHWENSGDITPAFGVSSGVLRGLVRFVLREYRRQGVFFFCGISLGGMGFVPVCFSHDPAS